MSSRRVVPLLCFALGLAVILRGDLPTAPAQDKKPLAVPVAPQSPTLTTPANLGAKPGAAVELSLTGTNLTDAVDVLVGGIGAFPVTEDKKPDAAKVKVKIDVPAKTPIGLYAIRVGTKHGVSNLRPFVVDDLPEVPETDANRAKDTAQPVPAPCVVTGKTDAEASDFFKVKVSAGQRLTFEVLARRIGSPLDPILVLHDAKTKRELVDLYADDTPGLQGDCRLTHTFKDAGEFLVEVRDTTYKGGADYHYRLRIGDFPGVTTAFPLAVERGKGGKVGFAGPGAADIPPVDVKVPEGALGAVYAVPTRGGASGWPVPVRISDNPETAEAEPNNEAAKANKLPVPGGVSAKFDKAGDIDCFTVGAKKGQKYVASALAFEVNAPTEVLIKVLDAKGAEVARSNPTQPAARVEFTPAADGDFTIACEHTNYLHGPNEVYHLTVAPASADFALTLPLDRFEAVVMPGGGTAVPVNVTRANGFAGPITLESTGLNLNGVVTVPAGATSAFVPLSVRGGAGKKTYPLRIRGTAKIDGKDVVRYATLTDIAKTALGGMPNPPQELLTEAAVAVIDKLTFDVKLTVESAAVEKGKAGKVLVEVTRGTGADGDITLAVLQAPANVTAAVKPIPKGQSKADIPLTVAPAAAVGPSQVVFRATTKVGGKDYTVTPLPVAFEVTEPKKAEPKKDEPKKEMKKDDPKKVEVKKEEPKKKDDPKKVDPKKKDEPKKDEPKKKDADPKPLVKKAVAAAGGEGKLLTLFRIKERLSVSADPAVKGTVRVSVLEPPKYWWVGKVERVKDEKEPATFLVWGWTLGAITDPKSKVDVIPDITEADKPAFGLRVSGTIDPPMDLYFDAATSRLVRIDWRADIHRFSDWREHDGATYPAKCVGSKKATGKPWYFTEILELERLKDLPAGLKR